MVKLVLLQSQVTGMDVHALVELGNGVLVVEVDVGEGKAEEELESWVEVVTVAGHVEAVVGFQLGKHCC